MAKPRQKRRQGHFHALHARCRQRSQPGVDPWTAQPQTCTRAYIDHFHSDKSVVPIVPSDGSVRYLWRHQIFVAPTRTTTDRSYKARRNATSSKIAHGFTIRNDSLLMAQSDSARQRTPESVRDSLHTISIPR